MIRNRILYCGLLICTLVLCYVKGSMGTSLLAYSLIFLGISSLIHVLWIYNKFTYTQELDKKFMTKGEKVNFHFSACNESSLFYPHLEVEFYGVDSIFTKYFHKKRLYVPENSKKTFTYEIECKYRGYYEIGIHKVYIIDFLGLYRLPYKVLEPKVVTVYPKITPLINFPIYPNEIEESEYIANHRRGIGNLTSDVREYMYGDTMHKVHWKLSAKRGELMVKNEDSTTQAIVNIVLDLKQHDHLDIESRTILEDKLVECVVAILYYCLEKSIPVVFSYFKDSLITHRGRDLAHFHSLYEMLFKIKFTQQIDFHKVIEMLPTVQETAHYWIGITSGLTYNLYEQIEQIVVSGSSAILINVGRGEEIIVKALKKLGVVYFEVGVEDDLSEVLRG